MNIKYFYKKTPCLLFLLALMMTTACTDDRVVDDSIYEDGPKIPIVLSLKGLFGEGTPTYALSDSIDQAGTGAENTITDVTVFIFNATNACEKILKAPNPFVNPMDTVLVTAGNKKIIAVVNGHNRFNPPSPGTSATFYSPGDEGSVSYNGLRTMLTNPAITALPVGPFLMTGETSENLQPDFPSTAPNEVTITVKRAVAKVKVYVKKANDVTQNLYMQKVTLSHGADMVSIIQNDPATASSISYNISSTARTTFTSSTIPDVASGTYCEPIDSLFYTFESLANRDKSKAAYLDLEVGVNSTTNIRTARVYLAANDVSPGDTIYDIHRNYWYCVYINIVDPGLDSVYVTVVASPWNVADTIHVDAGVGGYDVETATPFKLVKYYDAADFGKDNKIVAINKHSKGASWIDLKVSEGASWELNWTGGANTGAIMSADTFKTYVTYPTSLPPGTGKYSTTGTGTTDFQRIYIYRPFVENNEPKDGPSVTLKVGGQVVRTFKVEGRDSLIYPTNSYVLRPDVYTGGTSGSDGYIMLKPVYDFWEDFILSNGDSIPAGTPTAAFLWDDNGGSGVLSPTLSIINPGDRKNSYIRLRAGAVQGNAVVAFNVGGTTYWSFHIWNTEYNPYEPAGQILYRPSATMKNVFMDRNLGAMDTVYNANRNGFYYQFGRKDPFWTTASAAVAQPTAAASGVVRPRLAIPVILQNPTTFYGTSFTSHESEDGYLWNTKAGNKTAFDPCPEGYRIPKQENAGVSGSPWYNSSFYAGSGVFANGYYYTDSLNYFPGSYISTGGGAPSGTDAYYWTSSFNTVTGMYLSGTVDLVAPINKAIGGYVRCVVDKNYLQNKGDKFGRYTNDIKISLN